MYRVVLYNLEDFALFLYHNSEVENKTINISFDLKKHPLLLIYFKKKKVAKKAFLSIVADKGWIVLGKVLEGNKMQIIDYQLIE